MKTIEEKCALSKWFADSANWFVLFVKTNEKQLVVDRLQKRLVPDKYIAFIPTKDYAFRTRHTITTRKVLWIRGYVFIVATATPPEFMEAITPIINYDSYMYRILGNSFHSDNVALMPCDRVKMTTLLDENFNIPAFEVLLVGDSVRVFDGILKDIGGKILKVNKHRQTVTFEIFMFGRQVTCEVMMEYVTRDETVS
jgi:transcription antitermination factor NusG